MQQPASPIGIVTADRGHRDFVRTLSAKVFARFGDYETLLPGMLTVPWIRTWIAETSGEPVGFAMISLEDRSIGVVDLVAIAVAPELQAGGVGRRLLAHVESEACRRLRGPSATVRLTVAKDNARALDLFLRSGYVHDGRQPGTYPGGQPSIEMRKNLRPK